MVLSCEIETENEMPAQKKGLGTHWVWGLGYWKEPNGQYYLLVSHHGYYCAWPVHDLYESNKTPDINPRLNGGHLKKFRFSLFEVPVVKEREIMREIPRRAI